MPPRKPKLSDIAPVSDSVGARGGLSKRSKKIVLDAFESIEEGSEPNPDRPRPTRPLPAIRPNCFTYKDTIFKGQPHKKPVLTEEGYAVICQMRADAQPDPLIAYVLGLKWEQWVSLKHNDPFCEEICRLGDARLEGRLNDLGLKMAENNNVVALIFINKLIGRNPDKAPPPAPPQVNNINILNLPSALSVEEFTTAMAKRTASAGVEQEKVIETSGEVAASEPVTPAQLSADTSAEQMPDWLRGATEESDAVPLKAPVTTKADVHWEPLPEMPAAQRQDPVR